MKRVIDDFFWWKIKTISGADSFSIIIVNRKHWFIHMNASDAKQLFVKIHFFGINVQGLNGCPHIFAPPSILLKDFYIIEFYLAKVKINIFFLLRAWWTAEVIDKKLVVPCGV